ncbi:MAG: hypothetical protein WHT65_06625 [Pseudothermotoga sp.]
MKFYLFRRISIEVLILLLLTVELWATSSVVHSFILNLPGAEEPVRCFETESGFLVFAQEREQSVILAIELNADLQLKKLVTLDRLSFTRLNHVSKNARGEFVFVGYEMINRQSRIKVAILDEKLILITQYSIPVSGADQWAESSICVEDGFIVVGGHRTIGSNWYDAVVLKISREGKILWTKYFGGSADEWFSGVCELQGQYLCFGSTESYGKGQADFLVVLFSQKGNKIWDKTFGGNDWERAVGCVVTQDSIILAGSSNSFTSYNSLFAVKIDSDGRILWQKVVDLKEDFTTKGVVKLSEEVLVVYGELWSNESRRDVTYLFLKNSGELFTQQTFKMPGDQRVAQILLLKDGRMLILFASDNPQSSTDVQLYLVQQEFESTE